MATDLERLVVQLSADIKGYENAMRRAQGITGRNVRAIESQWSRLNKSIAASFKGFVGGLVAGVGIESIERLASALRGVVKEAADLVDTADKIGVNTDDLQRLLFGFSQAGVEAETVEKSLEQWGKRIGEAYTQGGPLATLLKDNNVSLTDGEGRLRSTVDLLREMAELIRRAGSDQERLAIANLAFGKAGSDMVLALKDGADGVNALMRELDRAGGVIEEGVLRRAAEIDDRFDAIANTIGTEVKSALLTGADLLVRWVDLVDSLAASWANFAGVSEDWAKKLLHLSGIPIVGPSIALGTGISGVVRDNSGGTGSRVGSGPFGLAGLGDADFDARFAGVGRESPTRIRDFGGSGGGKSRVDDLQREIAQIRERTDALRAETAAQASLNPLLDDYGFAVEKARASQELLTAAQQAGIKVTPALAADIERLATGYATAVVEAGKLAESQDLVRERMEEMRDLGKDALGGFIDDLVEGKSAAEAFAGVLQKIGSRLLDMGLDSLFSGGGPLGSLLGGVFGGGSAFPGVPSIGTTWSQPAGPMSLPKLAGKTAAASARIDIGISVDDDGKIVALARQEGGKQADIRVRQYAAGSFQRHLANDVTAKKRVRGYK